MELGLWCRVRSAQAQSVGRIPVPTLTAPLVGGCSPACEYTVLAPFVLLEGQGRLGAKSRRRVAGGQRLRAKGSGIGNFGGGWLEQPRQWLGTQWPGHSVAWECRAAQSRLTRPARRRWRVWVVPRRSGFDRTAAQWASPPSGVRRNCCYRSRPPAATGRAPRAGRVGTWMVRGRWQLGEGSLLAGPEGNPGHMAARVSSRTCCCERVHC